MRYDEAQGTTGQSWSLSAHQSLSAGTLLSDRYEVRELLREDPFSFEFRGFDEQERRFVLLRIVRGEHLEGNQAAEVARRLQGAVGMGGAFLPGLLDAAQHGDLAYCVEPLPQGALLRDIFRRRANEGLALHPAEALPVIARVVAALAAIPAGWCHGDVCADRIWIHPDGLTLTGPFLVPSLPAHVVRRLLRDHASLRARYAPEVEHGWVGEASDRFAVAMLGVEALSGREVHIEQLPRLLSELGELAGVLESLLHPNPTRRARSLSVFVDTLAHDAGLPRPRLDPAPFRNPRLRSGMRLNRAASATYRASPETQLPPLAPAAISEAGPSAPAEGMLEPTRRAEEEGPPKSETRKVDVLALFAHKALLQKEALQASQSAERPVERRTSSGMRWKPSTEGTIELTLQELEGLGFPKEGAGTLAPWAPRREGESDRPTPPPLAFDSPSALPGAERSVPPEAASLPSEQLILPPPPLRPSERTRAAEPQIEVGLEELGAEDLELLIKEEDVILVDTEALAAAPASPPPVAKTQTWSALSVFLLLLFVMGLGAAAGILYWVLLGEGT